MLIEHQHRHGTAAMLFMGSTGEPSLLSPEEKKRVVVETAKMRPPDMAFYYGCTGASTEQVIENVRFAAANGANGAVIAARSEEHTSELQSLMRISYAVFCLKKKNKHQNTEHQKQKLI